jgi:hypothetical protein
LRTQFRKYDNLRLGSWNKIRSRRPGFRAVNVICPTGSTIPKKCGLLFILFHVRGDNTNVNCVGLLSYRWCMCCDCASGFLLSVSLSQTCTPTPTKTRWRPAVLVPPTRGGRSENFPDWGGGGFLAHQYCQTIFQPFFCLTVRFCSS